MEKYDYESAVREDVLDYIEEHYTDEELASKLAADRDALYDEIHEGCWITDSVTGNGSGSYTFNAWRAEEYVCHNLDLLGEAFAEFGCSNSDALECGAESCDVTIRCYLLGGTISSVLDDKEEELEEMINKYNEE